jgi:branched-chain amino acid aminotransferase
MDPFLGVRPSATYKFMIILGPSGPYFSAPMKILIEEHYTRATPGGVGFAKNGGNYGASLYPVNLAQAI